MGDLSSIHQVALKQNLSHPTRDGSRAETKKERKEEGKQKQVFQLKQIKEILDSFSTLFHVSPASHIRHPSSIYWVIMKKGHRHNLEYTDIMESG